MKQLFSEIKKMKIGSEHTYSQPDPRREKQAPATIHLNFASPLTAREVESAGGGRGLEIKQQGRTILATGHGVRIHISQSRRPLIQIQASEMHDELTQQQRGNVLQFLAALPQPRKRNLGDRALDLIAKLLR